MQIMALCALSAGAGLLELCLPLSGKRSMRKSLHMLVSLLFLLLLATPLATAMEQLPRFDEITAPEDTTDYEAIFKNTLQTGAENDIKKGIQELVANEFKTDKENLAVTLTLGEDGGLSLVKIRLSGGALLLDPDEIEAFLAGRLNCEIEVR